MRWLLLICLGHKQINSKHETTQVAVILHILPLTGKSVRLSSSSWVLLGNAKPLLSQWWGCKLCHRKPVCSVACAKPWVQGHAFSPDCQFLWHGEGIQLIGHKRLQKRPKATWVRKSLLVRLTCLPRLCSSSWTQSWVLKLPRRQTAENSLSSFFFQRAKGRGVIPSLCSLQVLCLHQSTTVCNSVAHPGPQEGWQHFVCWRKQIQPHPVHAPVLSPKFAMLMQNTGLTASSCLLTVDVRLKNYRNNSYPSCSWPQRAFLNVRSRNLGSRLHSKMTKVGCTVCTQN